jgi:hypothetical protein
MSDVFKLDGSYQTQPTSGNLSGNPEVDALLQERVSLKNKLIGCYVLATDSPVSVSLGGLSEVNVLVIKTTGGKVRARITSADGSAQSVPVDPFCLLIDLSVGITAIDLTRVTLTSTTVQVFLGERTS